MRNRFTAAVVAILALHGAAALGIYLATLPQPSLASAAPAAGGVAVPDAPLFALPPPPPLPPIRVFDAPPPAPAYAAAVAGPAAPELPPPPSLEERELRAEAAVERREARFGNLVTQIRRQR
jgi:hypothetical protein